MGTLATFFENRLQYAKRNPAYPGTKSEQERADREYYDNARTECLRSLEACSLSPIMISIDAGQHDIYGNGEQSPIRPLPGSTWEDACLPLKEALRSQLLVYEVVLYLSSVWPLHSAAFFGDDRKLQILIDVERRRGGQEAVRRAVERRAGLMRFNALSYAVLGARELPIWSTVFGRVPEADVPCHWKACSEILISSGADVNARDIAGNPALSNIANGVYTSEASLDLVPLLSRAGADSNARNRFGEPILFQITRARNIDAFKALIAIGADVDLKSAEGQTSRQMICGCTAMLACITNTSGIYPAALCSMCAKPGVEMRCTNCLSVYYCSTACQRLDWRQGAHRQKCLGIWDGDSSHVDIDVAEEVKRGLPRREDGLKVVAKLSGRRLMNPKPAAAGKVFIVKVQLSSAWIAEVFDMPQLRMRKNIEILRCLPDLNNLRGIVVSKKNGSFCYIGPDASTDTSAKLQSLVLPAVGEIFSKKKYYAAQWQTPDGKEDRPKVLRICPTKILACPKSDW